MIKLLLQYEANPNIECKQTKNLPTKNDEWKTSPLHVSIVYNNAEAVSALIQAGADLNYQSDKGKTPLMKSLDLNRVQIVDYLLKIGPAEGLVIDKTDFRGNTALFSVCNCVHAGYFAQKLMDFGSNVNHLNYAQETALCVAVGLGCQDVTSVLLQNGAFTEVYHDGCTPLQCTAFENASHIAASLIYYGALLDVASNTLPPKTALEIAFEHGSYRVAQLLLTCGCNYSNMDSWIRSKMTRDDSWFRIFVMNPRKLSVLCRNTVRKHFSRLGKTPSEIQNLPVPTKVKSFLVLDEILSEYSHDDNCSEFDSLSLEESANNSSETSSEGDLEGSA